ncbi:hypothetical protein ACT3UJ_02135 [Halomonas sp. 86]|uniref:hypothetical protein n=1 Tax=unclassified Halomonas TaxID=2609666 RepID=UPI004034625C
MTSTAFDDQFSVCTPEEEEAFKAIEAQQKGRTSESAISSQRERFEAWVLSNLPTYGVDQFVNGGYIHSGTQLAWAAWQAACPEGWQVVPIQSVDQQIDAGCEATGDCEQLGECHHDCDCSVAPKVYRAMLSAAPRPGDA